MSLIPIVTRTEAKSAGLKRYFTGKPCKRGHVDQRNISCGACVSCERERAARRIVESPQAFKTAAAKYRASHLEACLERCRLWRKKNIEKAKDATFRWAEANREYLRLAQKVRRSENPEATRAQAREQRTKRPDHYNQVKRMWCLANPEKVAFKARKWRMSHPAVHAASQRNRRARLASCGGSHTAADIVRIGGMQRWRCAWCRKLCKTEYHVDHLIPISRGGSNAPSNLVISCVPCNQQKHAKDPLDFARERGMLL